MKKNNVFESAGNSEIIDDVGLIQCIQRLNVLRETGVEQNMQTISGEEALGDIDRISAEMKWFSQWLAVKMRNVA